MRYYLLLCVCLFPFLLISGFSDAPDEAKSAVEKEMDFIKAKVAEAPQVYNKLGQDGVESLQIGESFRCYIIDYEAVKKRSNNKAHLELLPLNEWVFIIYAGNDPVIFSTVSQEAESYELVAFSNITTDLITPALNNIKAMAEEKNLSLPEPKLVNDRGEYYLIAKFDNQEYLFPVNVYLQEDGLQVKPYYNVADFKSFLREELSKPTEPGMRGSSRFYNFISSLDGDKEGNNTNGKSPLYPILIMFIIIGFAGTLFTLFRKCGH